MLHTVYALFFKQRSDKSQAREQAPCALGMPHSLSKDPT